MPLEIRRYLRLFLLPFLLLWATGGVLWLLQQKGEVVLYLDGHHAWFWDQVFKYGTHFGYWGFLGILGLVFLAMRRYRWVRVLLVSALLQLVFIQGSKRLIWPEALRPHRYFKEQVDWHPVEGVKPKDYFSFPSGHTAIGFALFSMLALAFPRAWLQLVCMGMAVVVGLSRVYLGHHFLEDVLVGSWVGIATVFLGLAAENAWQRLRRKGPGAPPPTP